MNYAAILAGGQGTRMGGDLPKQFLPIHGTPILIHTVRQFVTCEAIDRIALCVPAAYIDYTEELLDASPDLRGKADVIQGGADRTGSLENACAFFGRRTLIGENDILITHDCVRPFVSHEMILSSIQTARQHGGATAAIPSVDTICISADGTVIDSVPDRATLYSVQTPQTFRMKEFCEILHSLTDEEKRRVTDASAVLRLRGHKVAISTGSPSNIKITHPSDLPMAEAIFHSIYHL